MKEKVILIQGAMDIEIECFVNQLENKEEIIIAEYPFYKGKIKNVQVIISKTLIGTVNATMATTIGIMHFQPNIVINQGLAGAHREDLHIGDIVIGEKCCNINSYSMPTKRKGEGSNPFEWELNKRAREVMEANKQLVAQVEKGLKLNYSEFIQRGTLGSGDAFNRETDRIAWITDIFKTDCEDMESIGTYTVCNRFQIPCVGIRIISNNEILLEKYDEEQARKLQKVIIETLPELVKET